MSSSGAAARRFVTSMLDVDFRRVRAEADLRHGLVVDRERNPVAEAAAQTDPPRRLVDHQLRRLEPAERQFAMQRVRVLGRRRPDPGDAAVEEEGPVGGEVGVRLDGFVEHRRHGEFPPVEGRAPDLLAVERQDDHAGARREEPQRRDAGGIAERLCPEAACRGNGARPVRREVGGLEWDQNGHLGLVRRAGGASYSKCAGSGPHRSPVPSAVMAATSSGVKAGPAVTAKFDAMRSAFVERGMTDSPRSTCQRSTTCAGVIPVRAAAARTGAASKLRPWPSGVQLCVTIPRAVISPWSAVCGRRGLISIWLRTGRTPVSRSSRSISPR